MITILIIILIIAAIGGLPNWGFHSYGAGPSGLFGLIVIVLIILYLTGHRF
jgi:Protein of unknown function (DUF3309).